MKVSYVEKDFKIAKRFKGVMEEKLAKLDRYFGEDATARVVCSKQNKVEKLEVTITNKGLLFRSEVSGANMYENIDLALPKLEKQIVRNRGKVRDKRKNAPKNVGDVEFEFLEEEPEFKLPGIEKRKSFNLSPVLVEEAKDALERLGHPFYVFLNARTGKVNVLYARHNGGYGLIEVNY